MPSLARPDWINLTGAENASNIAEFYVEEAGVRVVLEIFVNDVDAFRPVTTEGFDAIMLTDGEGRPLKLEAIPVMERRLRIDRYSPFRELGTSIPWAIVTQPPEDKRVYYAELTFAYNERPDSLVITPPLSANGLARKNIGMVVFHEGIPVTDFRYLGGREVLRLDWQDPWYSTFENPNLARHHQSALTSYLYVEPYVVRHEILIRPQDVSHWIDLGLADPDRIEPAEFRPLLDRMGEFLLKHNPVKIDGASVRPILDQAEFVNIGMYGVQTATPIQAMATKTAVVGIMLSYPTPGMPDQVRLQWDLFNERIQEVPATTIDPAGPFVTNLSPGEDTLVWQNFLQQYQLPEVERVPVNGAESNWPTAGLASLVAILALLAMIRARRSGNVFAASGVLIVAAGAAVVLAATALVREYRVRPLEPDEAALVMESLLKNVYHAFYLRGEEDVYDKLALTVSGELLEEVFLQQRKSFAIQSAGGAQGKVDRVQLLETRLVSEAAAADALAYAARWTATGAVSHWGHTHDRTNLYEATVTIAPTGDLWKITELRILREERLAQSIDDLPLPANGPTRAESQ